MLDFIFWFNIIKRFSIEYLILNQQLYFIFFVSIKYAIEPSFFVVFISIWKHLLFSSSHFAWPHQWLVLQKKQNVVYALKCITTNIKD